MDMNKSMSCFTPVNKNLFSGNPAVTEHPFTPGKFLFPSSPAQLVQSVVHARAIRAQEKKSSKKNHSIRLTKYVESKVSVEKILAILSGELVLRNENILAVPKLEIDARVGMDKLTNVGILSIVDFVDKVKAIPKLHLLHVKFLQELIQETVKTSDQAWDKLEQLADENEMSEINHFVNFIRRVKDLRVERSDLSDELRFILAVHCFLSNDNNPIKAVTDARQCSEEVTKLVIDMCMASYGLGWILGDRTTEFVSVMKDTYVIIC